MKKIAIVVGVLMLSTMAFAADSWTGYVTDAKCGASGKQAMISDSACVKKCMDGGEAAVLVVDGKVVKIANQDKIKGHEGHKVIVTGKLEGDTLTIATLKMAPKEEKKM
jgi:uncharacterized protein YdeI (BOF family)